MKSLLALMLASCAPGPDPPVEPVATFPVPTRYGFCGALAVTPGEAITPGHCAIEPLHCDTLRDLCWIADDRRDRLAVVRLPRRGESVTVTLPSGDTGRATVLATSVQWRAAWLDWPCLRGDSGGVAWGSDGAAVCMLTGCDVTTGATYCDELTP